ncbi:MAG: hypothetical protein HON90_04570 [Halobacteriovoraceae bacterium]|jgi:hypothetical protein|nr:hypothetical protein [Halobacteriovoraceae bacterium]
MYDLLMTHFRFFTTLLTMAMLAYGVLQIKTYLGKNFINNETPVKQALNSFLNGEASLKD